MHVSGRFPLVASPNAEKLNTACLRLLQDQRNLDEKLPLLFANRNGASEVKFSATGVLNGNAGPDEDGQISSSTVAVASPNGMILEQNSQMGARTDQASDPEAEGLIVSVRPSDNNQSPLIVEEKIVSPPVSMNTYAIIVGFLSCNQ